MTKIDFDQIRREYPLPQIVEASGINLEKNGREFKTCCPFHAEKTPSFTLFQGRSGHWKYHCYGCGISGDVIDYTKERYGVETGEAFRIITGNDRREPIPRQAYIEASDPYEGFDIGRPPEDAPAFIAGQRTPQILNPKRIDPATGKPKLVTYNPTGVYPYRNKNGGLIGYVLRVEFDGKKITPGVWWMKNSKLGFEGWSHGSFPSPRPLYGLEDFAENPAHQILLVEGEKCRDSAKRLMAGKRVIAASWMGGGKAISRVHWKSLAGRSVVIWPDNDEEGWKTALGFADKNGRWTKGLIEYVLEAGATTVKIVHIDHESRAKGWDIADAEAEGMDQASVAELMKSCIRAWSRQDIENWKKKELSDAGDNVRSDGGGNNYYGRKDRIPERDYPDEGQENSYTTPRPGNPSGNGRKELDDGRSTGFEIPEITGDSERPEHAAPGNSRENSSQRSSDGNASGQRGFSEGSFARSAERDDTQTAPARTGRGYDISSDDWRDHLIMKADGEGLKPNSLQNFALLLQFDPRFAGIFAWNDFAKEVYLQRRPPWDISGVPGQWRARKITDPDVTSAACWLEYCGMTPKRNDVGSVIQRVAQHNTYNPVTERLDELRWDGICRLSGREYDDVTIMPWMSEYLGAANTPENLAFGRKWMIGAVARAYQPGCKMDTMLILEGAQGLKKSSALRILSDAVVPGVFTDEISDPNSKDAGLQMQGAFIIEIAELDAFRRSEVSQIKAWLSRQSDRFRRPYGKIVEDFPRSCVFAGTVNPTGGGYLKDASGARRMWPVTCHEIDLEGLRKAAPQLWAEAVAAYQDGEPWWLDEEESKHASLAQEHRYEEDPYNDMIARYLKTEMRTTVLDIMKMGLEIPAERRSSLAAKRVTTWLYRNKWRKVVENGTVYYDNPAGLGFDQ